MRLIPMVATVALVLSASAQAQYSGSYGCTEDCSGHEAGYNWAERHDIDDPDDCGGRSQSFIEGCMDYAEQRQEELAEEEEEEYYVDEEGEECDPDYDDECMAEDDW